MGTCLCSNQFQKSRPGECNTLCTAEFETEAWCGSDEERVFMVMKSSCKQDLLHIVLHYQLILSSLHSAIQLPSAKCICRLMLLHNLFVVWALLESVKMVFATA